MDPEDIFPVLYNLIFIVINGYYILRWRPRWFDAPPPLCEDSAGKTGCDVHKWNVTLASRCGEEDGVFCPNVEKTQRDICILHLSISQ